MRIGILSDIHGNFTALQAVLAELERERLDLYLCLGDVVLMGPQPAECVERLRRLSPAVFILGNTDERIYDPPASSEIETDKDRQILSLIHWAQEHLSPEQVDFIRAFEPRRELDLGGGLSLLAYHGSPFQVAGTVKADTPEADLERLFAGVTARLCTGGHTHLPMVRSWGERLLINPGSVGAPFRIDERHFRPPWAEFAVLDASGDRFDLSLRHVPVDIPAARRAAFESGLPNAGEWANAWSE